MANAQQEIELVGGPKDGERFMLRIGQAGLKVPIGNDAQGRIRYALYVRDDKRPHLYQYRSEEKVK